MSPFIAVRVIALLGFLVFTSGTLYWMYAEHARLRAIPLLGGALHGSFYYGFYLFFYFYPKLNFDLQFFADWGAFFLMQIAWTGALITWDMATDWFSGGVIPWFLARFRGERFV